MKLIDLTGKRFGRLIVQWPVGRKGIVDKSPSLIWLCLCDCGNVIPVIGQHLRGGGTKSCGCFRHDFRVIHGHNRSRLTSGKSPEYNSWDHMVQRCMNRKNTAWKYYGGRGIKVCKRWQKFDNFLADMGSRPSTKHSIDRFPNNNGNYEPGNCRWATRIQQMNNTRRQETKKCQ